MSELKTFLKELRYHPAVQSLIPVGVCMGIPVCEDGGRLRIPFLKRTGANRCQLDSEFFVEFPSGEIYGYKKAINAVETVFNADELRRQKRELFGEETELEERKDDGYSADI